jgi:hypothetical protein
MDVHSGWLLPALTVLAGCTAPAAGAATRATDLVTTAVNPVDFGAVE